MKTNKKWTEERKDYLTVALMVTVLWQQWLFQTVERKRPAREVTVLLFPSVMRCFFSLILLFPLSTMFFPLCSSFVEVLAAVAWGVAWTVAAPPPGVAAAAAAGLEEMMRALAALVRLLVLLPLLGWRRK